MNAPALLIAALVMVASAPARGQGVDVTECAAMLEADEARLACYDRLVSREVDRQRTADPAAKPSVTATIQPSPPASAQAEPPSSKDFSKRSFKRIDPSDVKATPDKWLGRDLEFASANIYWVADDDLRVLTTDNMTLFGLSPVGAQDDLSYLKENCETSKEARSAKCRVRVRFNYIHHSEDNPSGMAKRTVLVAPVIEFARIGKPGGKPRR